MPRKWIVVTAAAGLLMTSALAGCSSKKGEPSSAPTEKGASPTAANKQPYSFTWALSNENTTYIRELKPDDPYTNELKKLTNVDVKYSWYETADREKIISTRIASNDLPDVLQLADTGINNPILTSAVDGGAFLPLNDLLDKYGQNILKAVPKEAWSSPQLSRNGKIYGIPKLAIQAATKGLFVRQDWLDKLKLKTPQTFDEYMAFFDAIKKTDLNGNGKNDEVPFSFVGDVSLTNWAYNSLLEGYYGLFPGQWKWVNGKAAPDQIDPRIKELLASYKMMYDKGYVNQDMFTALLKDRFARIMTGSVGSFIHDAPQAGANGSYGSTGKYETSGVRVSVLTGPTAPDGKKRFQPLGTGILRVNVISAKTKNPEEIIKYWDWMLSGKPEASNFFAYGVEGLDYTKDNGTIKYADKRVAANSVVYQYMLTIKDWRGGKETNALDPEGAVVQKALDEILTATDDRGMFKYMPVPATIAKNPQLGVGDGSLYADMFAKVVLGREPLDAAFDNYVKTWKAQGGDKAIEEATAWYQTYSK
ncbi:MAG: hypothetical protein J7639_13955 [Paenibacillaceae bacterium]|nr:hypothetical protein [Paenibacillaceae bacterium]